MPQTISIHSDALSRNELLRGESLNRTSAQKFFAYAWRILLVVAGYYIGSKVGFALTFRPYAVSTLWPPNAVIVGALLISPTRMWPWMLLAAFFTHIAVQLRSDVPLVMVFCWFVSNTSEALIGAGLVRRFLKNPVRLNSLKQIALLLFFTAFLGPFLSSFLDAAFVKWNHWGVRDYWQVWRMRFFSNVLAEMTIVPVIISWSQIRIDITKVSFIRFVELALLSLSLTVVVILFNREQLKFDPLWVYLPIPFLLWGARRFGFSVLTASILIMAFVSISGAVGGHSPFKEADPVQNALSIQIFLIAFAVPLLLFTSVLEEGQKVRKIALQDEERLRLALSAAQMTTWDLHIPTKLVAWSDQSKIPGAIVENNRTLNSYLEMVHPEDRLKVSDVINRTMADGGTYEIEFRLLLANGKVFWQLGKGEVTFDEKGRPVRLLGVNVDITERKNADEVRRRAEATAQVHRQELYHLSRVAMLAELSGTIAHELNQPLTAILSNAQAAQRYLEKDKVDLDEVREIIKSVIDQDRRAGDVIKRLMGLLKKGEVERRPIDLNQIVQEVLRLVHSEFITHNIKIKTEFSKELPAVEGDRVQLQQMLLNLIMNAIDAMKEIEPQNRELTMATDFQNSTIHLSVLDRGEGIPEENLDKVFDPFYTTKEHGLGLGLSICRAIVVAHGGQMTVKNNPDHGAIFLVQLPVG